MKFAICIPTYNRSEIIAENVERIYIKYKKYFLNNQLHFFISNNASNDQTIEKLNQLNLKYNCLTLYSNETNLGYELNFNNALLMSKDYDYSILLGDDDTLVGDLEVLFNQLDKIKPDFFILSNKDKSLDIILNDYKKVFNDYTNYFTWMSSIVFKSSIIENLNFKRYSGYYFGHVGAILEYICNNEFKFQFMNLGTFVDYLRPGYVEYNSKILDVYAKGFCETILHLPDKYTLEEKKNFMKQRVKITGMMSNKVLMSLRSKKQFNPKLLKKYYNYIKYFNSSSYLILYLISIFPTFIFVILRFLYCKINNIKYN